MDRLLGRAIFGDDDDDDGSGSRYPYGWFVVPIIGAIGLACAVMLLRYRRRKLRTALAGYRNNALRQDIEAMGPPRNRPLGLNRTWYMGRINVPAGHNGGPPPPPPGGPGHVAAGQNEGLNEFGEAPPAYTASSTTSRHKQQSAVEEIELGSMSRSRVNVAVPPAAAAPAATLQQGSPPSYNEAQQGSVGSPPGSAISSPDGPERPPPAVLGSR